MPSKIMHPLDTQAMFSLHICLQDNVNSCKNGIDSLSKLMTKVSNFSTSSHIPQIACF